MEFSVEVLDAETIKIKIGLLMALKGFCSFTKSGVDVGLNAVHIRENATQLMGD